MSRPNKPRPRKGVSLRPEVAVRALFLADHRGESLTALVERLLWEECDAAGVPDVDQATARRLMLERNAKRRAIREEQAAKVRELEANRRVQARRHGSVARKKFERFHNLKRKAFER